jgi:hypothetical protein
MADKTYNLNMAIGETDDPNATIVSYEAAAAVTKGDPVYLSADDKVSPAAAAQDCIGIAVKTAAQGAMCSVLTSGRVKVKAGGVINRGKAVYAADASKRGAAKYSIYYNRRIGTAQETTSAADKNLIRPEEFRKNAVKILGWELWENTNPQDTRTTS